MIVEIEYLFDDVLKPEYATDGSSGFDLAIHNFKKLYKAGNNAVDIATADGKVTLAPGARALVGCGYKVAIPAGFEMQVRPRSGKALKEGLTVLNSPGTVDSDYRGEVGIILINESTDAIVLEKGDKVAQGVIQSVYRVSEWRSVTTLDDTDRGEGGFGSTDNNNRQITNQNY